MTGWQDVRRLLAVRLDNLGDVLLTTPALHAIKQTIPGVELTLLASPVGAQAGALNRDVDDVIVHQAPWMDPWGKLPRDSRREQAIIDTIRRRRFDGAIIFTSFRQSSLPAAYLCYLADIPLRLGASLDGPGSLLTTRHRHPERMMHEVERGLDLVTAVFPLGARGTGDLVLTIPEGERRIAGELAEGMRRGRGPLIVLHPGCSMPARRAPWEQFAASADLLVERLDATVVITGGAEELQLVDAVRRRMRHPSIGAAGTLPFATFCALIEAAELIITNNTGPMHIAAAVKTPVAVLFALTNPPEQWGPWRVPHRLLYHDVPCRLCYHRVCPTNQECVSTISPETVAGAAESLLRETGFPIARTQFHPPLEAVV